MHVPTSFASLTFALLIWYSCLRWWWFKKGPTINPDWSYEWAKDGINKFTAYLAIVFLTCALFTITVTFNSWQFYCLAGFLLVRNIWYAIEDIYAYSIGDWNSQTEQAFFVITDLAMVVQVLYWAYLMQ